MLKSSLVADPRPSEDGEADVGDGFKGGDGAEHGGTCGDDIIDEQKVATGVGC